MTLPGFPDQARKEAVRNYKEEKDFFLKIIIHLSQTEIDDIFNDFSNLEIKGSQRKMIDNSNSNHTEAKEINSSQERCLVSRMPGEAALFNKNNSGCSCHWLCHLGQSTSLSLSFLMYKVRTFFYFLKLDFFF